MSWVLIGVGIIAFLLWTWLCLAVGYMIRGWDDEEDYY